MNLREGQRPLVAAHRGSSGSAPENTMAAFRMAAAAGADMIEFDVRMTGDFELVVHHDRRLGRTSDGSGRIGDLTLRDIKTFDAGSWYSRRFRGERIPTLHEVLEEFPRSLGMNIEVKTDGETRKGIALAESVLRAVLEFRPPGRTESGTGPTFVSSFNHAFLRRLHMLDPSVRTGALYLRIRDGFRPASRIARRAGASVFVCSRAQLRARHIRDARTHDLTVAVYGVNTRRDLAAVRRAGADVVITDYPERIIRALRSF